MPKAKRVFLDTQVFEQELYDFDSRHFTRLKTLVDEGLVRVILTEITYREVISRIRETVAKGLEDLKSAVNKNRPIKILRHLTPTFDGVFAKLTPTELAKILELQFEDFRKALKINTLPIKGVTPSKIFQDYFESRPPFSQGRKKNEFPDAFAAALLKKDAVVAPIYVVSGDEDWKLMCDKQLIHISSLTEFFALFPNPDLASALRDGLVEFFKFTSNEDILERFRSLRFETDGVDGKITKVEDIEISIEKIVIVEAKEGVADAEMTVNVEFNADVDYVIEDTGYWEGDDSKTDQERAQRTIRASAKEVIDVSCNYYEDDNEVYELNWLEFQTWSIDVDCQSLPYDF